MSESNTEHASASHVRSPSASVQHLLQFRGIRADGPDNEIKLPLIVDLLVLAELSMLFLRNAFVEYHPVAWVVGVLMAGYIALIVIRPRSENFIKLLFLGVTALTLAIAIPFRTGETISSTAYAALGGILAIFYALGTRTALTIALAYLAYTAHALWMHPTPVGGQVGYTLSSMVGITSVLLLVGLVANHMSLQADLARQMAERKAVEIENTLESLRLATSAGNVGTFSHSSESPYWTVNASFRQLLDLPEQAYPQIQAEDVLQRIAPDEVGFALDRLNAGGTQEPGSYQLLMPNGKRLMVTTMAQTVTEPDGRWTRYGIAYATAEQPGYVREDEAHRANT